MDRRAFLRTLGLGAAVAAGIAVDPERLGWVKGARTFFLPQPKLAFDKRAFAFVMQNLSLQDFQLRYVQPAADLLSTQMDGHSFYVISGGKGYVYALPSGQSAPILFQTVGA